MNRRVDSRLLSRDFVRVWVATLGAFASFGMVVLALPLYAKDELGRGSAGIGIAMGAASLTSIVFSTLSGRFADRRGRRPLLLAGGAVMVACYLALALTPGLAGVIGIRLIAGAAEATFVVGAYTVIADIAPESRRGEALSLVTLASYLGLTIGPVLADLVLGDGRFTAVWLVTAGLVVVSLAMLVTFRETKPQVDLAASPGWLPPRGALVPGLLVLVGLLGFGGFVTFAALYARDLGIDRPGLVFALFGGVICLVRAFGRKLPDALGARRTLVLSFLTLAAGLAMIGGWQSTTGPARRDRRLRGRPGPHLSLGRAAGDGGDEHGRTERDGRHGRRVRGRRDRLRRVHARRRCRGLGLRRSVPRRLARRAQRPPRAPAAASFGEDSGRGRGVLTDDPLGLDPETMRQLGYRAVDMLVERLSDPSIPPLRRASPDEMAARLGGPPPDEPEAFDEILRRLGEDVLPFMSRGDHPGFFAFIPFSGTWPGALGDLVASASNVYAGSWMESAGPSQVELEVLGWFKDWVGYPPEAAGILVSGGSAANMTALACARESRAGTMADDLVAYVSDQTHSSFARAARNLGFRPEQVRVLPVDERYRLRTDLLAAAMDADLAAGRRPLFVSANGGATNTGAVDPLPELADICRERGAWFHVDAAYGGFAVLAEAGREQLAGLERADSITLDPHKWLYQPYECGCLLVHAAPALEGAFSITPDYLKDAIASAGEINFSDLGMQLTRSSRALKIWVSIRYFGLDAFRRAIERTLELAGVASDRIDAERRARAAGASVTRDRLLPAAFRGARRRGGARAAQRPARVRARGERPRARLLDQAPRPVRDPDVRHEPHHAVGGRRASPRLPGGGRGEPRRYEPARPLRAASRHHHEPPDTA